MIEMISPFPAQVKRSNPTKPQSMDWSLVTGEPLDLNQFVAFVSDPSAGAISTFSGVTRNNFNGKAVKKLEYEAYVPMAVKKIEVGVCMAQCIHYSCLQPIQEIITEIKSRWDVCKVAIGHRTGVVNVGEPSVVIAVSSAHRRASLEVRIV